MTILLCDVGGTHVRFALDRGAGQLSPPHKLKVRDFDVLEDAIETFLSSQNILTNTLEFLYLAFSNRNEWQTTPDSLNRRFPALKVRQVNDFMANAYGIITAKSDDFLFFRSAQKIPSAESSRAVIGVGTGLGLAYLCQEQGRIVVQRTHGGHMLCPAVTSLHKALFDYIQNSKTDGTVPIYEDALSGRGLYTIYKFLCAEYNISEEFDGVEQALVDGKEDKVFRESLNIFTGLLGLFAHQVLAFGHSYSGLYLTGGVLDKIIAAGLFDFSVFDQNLQQKLHPLVMTDVASTPIAWIKDEFISLRGLAYLAQKDSTNG
jgi:glucokinase